MSYQFINEPPEITDLEHKVEELEKSLHYLQKHLEEARENEVTTQHEITIKDDRIKELEKELLEEQAINQSLRGK